MNFRFAHALLPALALLLLAHSVLGQGLERTRLYTPPDPGSPGGLTGRITKPELPLEQILALPTNNPESVYLGEISGSSRNTFRFKGLPASKYDLVVVYPSTWYEGLRLAEANSLTSEDTKKIGETIEKAEPFFTKRIVHRVEGETGRGNFARCICTFVREKGSELLMTKFEGKSNRADFRRTFKLVILKDVGVGWQIVRARDLYPVWVDPKKPLPEHHFSAALGQIRIADATKDLGELDLSR